MKLNFLFLCAICTDFVSINFVSIMAKRVPSDKPQVPPTNKRFQPVERLELLHVAKKCWSGLLTCTSCCTFASHYSGSDHGFPWSLQLYCDNCENTFSICTLCPLNKRQFHNQNDLLKHHNTRSHRNKMTELLLMSMSTTKKNVFQLIIMKMCWVMWTSVRKSLQKTRLCMNHNIFWVMKQENFCWIRSYFIFYLKQLQRKGTNICFHLRIFRIKKWWTRFPSLIPNTSTRLKKKKRRSLQPNSTTQHTSST